MKQKFKNLILSGGLIISFFSASAYDFESDGFYFEILSEDAHTVAINALQKSVTGDIIIPSQVTYTDNLYTVVQMGSMEYEYPFENLDITSISIPSTITSIANYPFVSCSSLKEINVDSNNPYFTSIDGVLFDKNIEKIISYPGGKEQTTFEIPNSVNIIGGYAFNYNDYIKEIKLPEYVESIERDAFIFCTSLEELTIPEGVTEIPQWMCQGCSTLKKVTLPWTLKAINQCAFIETDDIEEIIILATVPPICVNSAFSTYTPHSITLYVPYGCASVYEQADVWKEFSTIIEMDPVNISAAGISPTSAELNVGETLQIEVDIYPANATNKTVIYSSSEDTIATVSQSGLVTALAPGYAIINVEIGDFSTSQCVIRVTNNVVEAEQIVLNFEAAEINIGETLQLEATVLPEDTTDKTLTWTSSDPNVATVSDNGVVKAVSAGTAIITVACGEVTAECTVTVLYDAGVESLLANPNNKFSIYSVDGTLIKKDCKVEDLKTLNKGIYIIVSGKERYKIAI